MHAWKLAPRPRIKHEKRTAGSAWETWTVAVADGVRFARVRWEINFLLIFETAPFFCKHPVYKPRCTVIRSADENRICRAIKSVLWIGIKTTQRAWWFVFRKLKNRLVTASANLVLVTLFRNSYVEDSYICRSSFLENYFNRLICYTNFMMDR